MKSKLIWWPTIWVYRKHNVKSILDPPIFEYMSLASETHKHTDDNNDENMIYTKDGKTRYNINLRSSR